MDKSNGYEAIAEIFANGRGRAINGIGTSFVRRWASSLPPASVVLDLGCGTGVPVSRILIDAGMTVYGIDAAPTLVKVFHQNFPDMPIACEAAEESSFFDRQFDAIISWGLMFIISVESQISLLKKAAGALRPGGIFLFTATRKADAWNDAMTDQPSISLGAAKYKELIIASGLSLSEEFEDEGQNYYFNAIKP